MFYIHIFNCSRYVCLRLVVVVIIVYNMHCRCRFPKDDVTRSLWLQICNLNMFDNVSTIKICSEHFTIEDYQNPLAPVYGAVLRLKSGTIPTVAVPNPIVPIPTSANKLGIDVEVTTNVASTYQLIASKYVIICGANLEI